MMIQAGILRWSLSPSQFDSHQASGFEFATATQLFLASGLGTLETVSGANKRPDHVGGLAQRLAAKLNDPVWRLLRWRPASDISTSTAAGLFCVCLLSLGRFGGQVMRAMDSWALPMWASLAEAPAVDACLWHGPHCT